MKKAPKLEAVEDTRGPLVNYFMVGTSVDTLRLINVVAMLEVWRSANLPGDNYSIETAMSGHAHPSAIRIVGERRDGAVVEITVSLDDPLLFGTLAEALFC